MEVRIEMLNLFNFNHSQRKGTPHSNVTVAKTANLLKLGALGALSIALAIIAPPESRAQTQSPENPTDSRISSIKPDLSAYVSQDLDPKEQSLVRATLSNLPRQMQEQIAAQPSDSVHIAIVEGGTGIIHYNRAEDVGSYEAQPATSLPGDEYPFSEDTGLAADAGLTANASLDPGLNPGTGPYRRVYTPPVAAAPEPALSQINYQDLSVQHIYETGGSVSIGCDAGLFAPGDIGYSYMGGWSGTWNTLTGANAVARAIDAGLQYSPANNNYAMIMTIAGSGTIHTVQISKSNTKDAVLPPRIDCTDENDWADMYFAALGAYQLQSVAPNCWNTDEVPTFIGFPYKDCNTYVLRLAVASDQFDGHIGGIQFFYIFWFSPGYQQGGWGELQPFTAKNYRGAENVAGWVPRAPCGSCTFKWMTSIAQQTQDLTDQSWYTASWSNREISGWPATNALVSLTKEKTNCTEYPLWHASYPTKHSEDCEDTPKGMTGQEKSITVTNYAPTREMDLISLTY
jgi:hypothetical protein